jgi:hypothetical protein
MLVRCALAAALAAPFAACQPAPAWAELTLPQGVNPTALAGQGKLVVYRDATTLHVFSAVTRQWRTTPIDANATLFLCNDVLVVIDPGNCIAFSSYFGDFVDQPVGAGASLANSAANKNDSIVLISDGPQVHAFSCFTGQWLTRAVGPGYGVAVQRHVALLAAGTVLAGMDAFTGQWHDLPVTVPATSLAADGTAAFASAGGMVHGFAAMTGSWHSAPALAGATFARGDDWGMWYGQGQALAFSGLRGGFVSSTDAITGLWASEDLFALCATPLGLVAWSAVTATFSAPQVDPLTVASDTGIAMLEDVGTVRAYSPLHQSFVQAMFAADTPDVAGAIGYALEPTGGPPGTGRVHMFSSLTGQWHTAPVDARHEAPLLTTTTAGLRAIQRAYAFASHDGAFVPLPWRPFAMLGNPSSAPLCAYDAFRVAAFDARTSRWRTVERTEKGAPVFAIWRTVALVQDGDSLLGFHAIAGTWHVTEPSEPPPTLRANSEVVYAASAHVVSACGMLPQVLPFAQFPEFRRVQTLGVPMRWLVSLPPQSVAGVAFGTLATTPTALAGLGDVLVADPFGFVLAAIGVNGTPVDHSVVMPAAPSLVGLAITGQALVFPPTGTPYLSDTGIVRLW